jgi:hypothetical protein
MTPADYARPITADGEYSFPATIPAGNVCHFQITGNFSGAAVTPGYISEAGVFTALGSAVTAAATLGPYSIPSGPTPGSETPGQATPALSITGGVAPSISLTISQQVGGNIPLNADSIADAMNGSSPSMKSLSLGRDKDDSKNVIRLRAFRKADGTELPKTRIVIDRGAAGDAINQDYLSFVVTHNLDWDTDTRDDLTLPTSRLGIEYQYNDGLLEFNWDTRKGDGTVIPRVFHIEQPSDGTLGNGSINNNMGFPSIQVSADYLGNSITAAKNILIYGNPGSDNIRCRIESTNTSHNSAGLFLRGNATAGGSFWSFCIDRFRNGSKDAFITDELTSETPILTFKFGTKVSEFAGDVEVTDLTKGVVIKSPNGNRWRLTVSNAGAVSATAL